MTATWAGGVLLYRSQRCVCSVELLAVLSALQEETEKEEA
jgi:hypothetical protein